MEKKKQQKKAKSNRPASQKDEIIWNIVNSLIAGGLVFLGAFSTGNIGKETIIVGVATAGIVGLSQFQKYWIGEKDEYLSGDICKRSTKLFSFVKI